MLVSLSALLVFAGSACLIAAMYVQAATLPLVFAGNDFCYETSRNFGAAFSGLVRNRPGVGSKLRRFIDGP